MPMKISIVMTTYNGERYLLEQLESLRNQVVLPDEVIIVDDRSTDNTVSITRDFIFDNGFANWKLLINEKNLGWRSNFIRAIDMAEGELIFLSDQDDIWNPDKIMRMSGIMEENDQVMLLASNYEPLYLTQNAKRLPRQVVNEMRHSCSVKKVAFDKSVLYVSRPGCVYCFRRSFWNSIASYYVPKQSHDGFLWRMALLHDGLFIYNSPTIMFRRHDSNASVRKNYSKAARISEIDLLIEIFESLLSIVADLYIDNKDSKKRLLQRILLFLRLRKECYTDRKLSIWLKLVCEYQDLYKSTRAKLGDLFYLIKRA